MKKYAALIAFSFMIVFAGFAQTGGLKGPAAKNYKPWKNPQKAKVVAISKKEVVKGPEAKNYKPWKNPAGTTPMIVIERKTLKGPRAKNSRPFEYSEPVMIAEAKSPKKDN